MDRIVLAYSGGLDTSVAIPWLAEKYSAEIIAVTLDLGQGKELEDVGSRARAVGAVQVHVIDIRDEFVKDYVFPSLRAGALYEDHYPMATALGRPLIAKKLIEVADQEGADSIAHGCTGKGNDQVRIDVSARALNPEIHVVAPAREWGMTRPDEIAYAASRGIPVPVTVESPYSTDSNLWGRSIECGILEDPWVEPPEEIYELTQSPADAPDDPAYVEIEFEAGIPVSLNGSSLGPKELISALEAEAGRHGVGRLDMVENRLVGIKSREIYEAPAAVVLHMAHRALEALVIPRDLERLHRQLGRVYADLVYNGLWFTPSREAIDAFVNKVQERVTGRIRVKLFKGNCSVVGRQSLFALYNQQLATYDEGDLFDHSAAEGFIKIWGLPLETAARLATLTKNEGDGE